MRVDVTTGKHLFDVREKLGIDGHHVFEVAVGWTILDHPDFAVALDDLRFDFADLFIDQNADVFPTADDLFARFDNAVGTEGIGRSGPTQCWLTLLPRFQKGFVRPFWSKRRIGLVLIYRLNCVEKASRDEGQSSLRMLNRAHRLSVRFKFNGVPWQIKTVQGRGR